MKATRDDNLVYGGIKRVRRFNRKNLPQLIRLYKAGWTLAALKRKWHCYGNRLVKLLIGAGVYRKICLSNRPEYNVYNLLRWHCTTGGGWRSKFFFKSFIQFWNEVGPRPSNKHWIRKIDTKGHYAPGNV